MKKIIIIALLFAVVDYQPYPISLQTYSYPIVCEPQALEKNVGIKTKINSIMKNTMPINVRITGGIPIIYAI
jgi:hypothetical protein